MLTLQDVTQKALAIYQEKENSRYGISLQIRSVKSPKLASLLDLDEYNAKPSPQLISTRISSLLQHDTEIRRSKQLKIILEILEVCAALELCRLSTENALIDLMRLVDIYKETGNSNLFPYTVYEFMTSMIQREKSILSEKIPALQKHYTSIRMDLLQAQIELQRMKEENDTLRVALLKTKEQNTEPQNQQTNRSTLFRPIASYVEQPQENNSTSYTFSKQRG